MQNPKNKGQAHFRLGVIYESRCAVALLALLALATVSVTAATSALSREHASRVVSDLLR
jgi:hypothetical protein